MLWKPLTNTFSKPEQFRAWVNMHGVFGRLAFVCMIILQVIFALIPGEPLELGAGYAFGIMEGTALCLAGVALGSVIIFMFTKRLGIKMAEAMVGKEKIHSLHFVKDSKNLNLLIFFLYFIPGTPKDIFTYFIGLTPMKLKTFLLLSSIARIPSVITSTITGNALGVKDYKMAAIVYAIAAAISLTGIAVYRKTFKLKQKRMRKKTANDYE